MSKGGTQETILVVEDDAALRLSLQLLLRSRGFRVLVAKDGEEGLDAAFRERPHLLLLDLMMPKMNGFEVCREIRRRDPELPILLLTAKTELEDRLRGLSIGADDYVTKPFVPEELVARIHAALRRTRLVSAQTLTVSFGDVVVDFGEQTAKRKGDAVPCTAVELKLLRYLIETRGRVVSRQQILDAVWGADYFGTPRTVDNFMSRLRTKFEADAENPRHFLTIRGMGYRFDVEGNG